MEKESQNNSGTMWDKSKILIKGFIIGFLVLILLIPSYYVQSLVKERRERQREAFNEVSSKWASAQNISGPVIVLPYTETVLDEKKNTVILKKQAYFLPDKLDMHASVIPEKRYRGIYQVMLYTSNIAVSGSFSSTPWQQLKLQPGKILWNEAFVFMGISDAKGLRKEIHLKWNDEDLVLNPGGYNKGLNLGGFAAPLFLNEAMTGSPVRFSTQLQINGSEQLLFTPVGKETNVQMESIWPDPSFNGSILPQSSTISDSGFSAQWKSLAHTRSFPQQWKDDSYEIETSAFGTDLYIAVSGYQKTMRSVKYAVLCILLTFAAFFLIETVNKKSVHPLQYGLVGLALIIFYTLLLSLSEYMEFNTSYIISTIATVGLITWFVKGVLGSVRLSVLLSMILVLMYGYVFTILQLQDYALLLGSIGLFITLAVVMYFTRRIQW